MAANVGHDQMKSGNAKRQTGVVEHNTISGTSATFDTQHSSVHERNSPDVRNTTRELSAHFTFRTILRESRPRPPAFLFPTNDGQRSAITPTSLPIPQTWALTGNGIAREIRLNETAPVLGKWRGRTRKTWTRLPSKRYSGCTSSARNLPRSWRDVGLSSIRRLGPSRSRRTLRRTSSESNPRLALQEHISSADNWLH